MNKKRLIILISMITIFLVGLSLYFGISKYYENKKIQADKESVISVSKEFTNAWYNYTKQTDLKYLNSIKPYMAEPFFEATKYVNTSRLQDFAGQEPMSTSVLSAELVNYGADAAETKVFLNSKEGNNRPSEYYVFLELEKVNTGWLVSEIKTSTE